MMTALLTLPGQSGIEIRRLYEAVDASLAERKEAVDASLAERKYDRPLADLNRASDLAPEFALPNGSSACSNVRLCLGVRNPYLGRAHRRSQAIGAMRGGEIFRRCCAPWNQKVGVFSWFPSKIWSRSTSGGLLPKDVCGARAVMRCK